MSNRKQSSGSQLARLLGASQSAATANPSASSPTPDFDAWLSLVSPRWRWDWRHLVFIRKQLARLTAGEIKHLGLFLPPRHGKSEQTTIRYPVWRMERKPDTRVCVGCYNQTFAEKFGRKARRIARDRLSLSTERSAAREWETTAGGVFRACGVGNPPTGEGFDLLIIDDPVKSREEAESEAYRDRVWDWYTDDLYSRLEPGAAVVLILTRWHLDDIAGRIMASDQAGDWTFINLPAEAEDDEPAPPAGLGRRKGEALCPERYDEAALRKIHQVMGPGYLALYQQRPVPREGSMFKRDWLTKVLPARPAAPLAAVRYWDKAGTADGGAYTCGVLMLHMPDGTFVVADVVRGQWSSHDRNAVMRQVALADGPDVAIWVEQEPGSGGKESAEISTRELAGFAVYIERVTGTKETRALPFAAQCEAGNVRLVQSPWLGAYVDELTTFPAGAYKDQVDASSGAFNKLTLGAVQPWEVPDDPGAQSMIGRAPAGVFLDGLGAGGMGDPGDLGDRDVYGRRGGEGEGQGGSVWPW